MTGAHPLHPLKKLGQHIFNRVYIRPDEMVQKGQSFADYDLKRCKFIIKRSAEHFHVDKHEPAPLLNRSLLDIGCGISRIPEELTFRGADVTAIDMEQSTIDEAKALASKLGAPIELLHISAEGMAKQGRVFDVVTCLDVLAHVDNLDSFLDALTDLVSDKGLIIFSAKNKSLKSYYLHVFLGQMIFNWQPHGKNIFSKFIAPNTLKREFEKRGFHMDKVQGYHLNINQRKWVRAKGAPTRYLGVAFKKTVE